MLGAIPRQKLAFPVNQVVFPPSPPPAFVRDIALIVASSPECPGFASSAAFLCCVSSAYHISPVMQVSRIPRRRN